jgi:hypothetical protein
MMQLLIRENYRGWETINSDPPLYDAVTANDITRVVSTYFTPETRAVAVYYREESESVEDDRLLGLDDEERARVQQLLGMLEQMDKEKLEDFLDRSREAVRQTAPENQDMAEVIVALIHERLTELGGRE